jgi:hypothetical protein
MRAAGVLGDVEVLKVGHHGSDTSTSADFLNAITPEDAVISVGAENDYGHPDSDTLGRLGAVGVTVHRTDEDGTVVLTSDCATYSLATGGESVPTPTPTPPTPRPAAIATATPTATPTKTPTPEPTQTANCHPSYPDVCLCPNCGDYDCAGGSGNGPNYVSGPVRVLPPDPFDLDRDGDGWGCQ